MNDLATQIQEDYELEPFTSPTSVDPARYGELKTEQRRKLMVRLAQLERVDALLPGWLQVAPGKHGTQGKVRSLSGACKLVAKSEGVSWKTLERSYQRYTAHGCNPFALVDRRPSPETWNTRESRNLPTETVEYFKKLAEENQRSSRQAYVKLMLQLKNWRMGRAAPIPGYATPPANYRKTGHPRGWSYANFMEHAPAQIELKAARLGRTAAMGEMPPVLTTRVGSYVGAEIQFDDMWHDFAVSVFGERKERRILEFGAVDHYSGYILQSALKPRVEVSDSGKMRQLSEKDFLYYVVTLLSMVGWNPRGTVYNLEHGTATVRPDRAELITQWTDGEVVIRKSGMTGKPAFSGQYKGRSKGNFKAKALKEGYGKLIHAALGDLGGQTGQDRDHVPEEYHGRSHHNELLLAMAQVHPELRETMEFGFLPAKQAINAIHEVYRFINGRVDHEIEGFDQDTNLQVAEICIDPVGDNWIPLERVAQMPAQAREALKALVSASPDLRRIRRKSPAEVWESGIQDFRKLPVQAIPDILGVEFARSESVQQGLISWKEDGVTYRFRAKLVGEASLFRTISNGDEFLTYLNPANGRLILCEPDTNVFLGECEAYNVHQRGDVEAINKTIGEREADFRDAVAGVAIRSGLGRGESYAANTRAIKRLAWSDKERDRMRRDDITQDRSMPKRKDTAAGRGYGDFDDLIPDDEPFCETPDESGSSEDGLPEYECVESSSYSAFDDDLLPE